MHSDSEALITLHSKATNSFSPLRLSFLDVAHPTNHVSTDEDHRHKAFAGVRTLRTLRRCYKSVRITFNTARGPLDPLSHTFSHEPFCDAFLRSLHVGTLCSDLGLAIAGAA